MSRRKLQRIMCAIQQGRTLDEARKEARSGITAKPWRMVDAVTSQQIAVLSVRKSRARKQAKLFGDNARLVRE